ncbi:hypothetical protein JCM8547_009031 [Rhodosporidiobolus lusitaniae]
MSARTATSALKGASARGFASTSAARLPPKPNSPAARAAQMAKQRKQATNADEEGAAVTGTGNVLSEVTLPRPDLSGLKVLHPESVTKRAVGQVLAFPDRALESFKALSIPGSIQREHAFTPRPAAVVRGATVKAVETLEQAKEKGSSKGSRFVLAGGSGSGKSTLLLQAVSYAQSTDWVVLYLPSATPLVNSSTPHLYSSSRALFDQPLLSSSLLSKFTAANKAAFKALKTSKEHTFGLGENVKKVAKGKSLEDLAKAHGGDEKTVTAVFETVMEELSTQTERPVLLALDSCQSLFSTTSYLTPSYHPVEAFELVVPRLLLDYVSGARTFGKGAVLLAKSGVAREQSAALNDFLAASEAEKGSEGKKKVLESAYDRQTVSSYSTYLSILQSTGVQTLPVEPRLSRQEAVGVVEMLKGFRATREAVDDKMFLERLVTTDGNPREFARVLRESLAV